jgi:hypothetical protein
MGVRGSKERETTILQQLEFKVSNKICRLNIVSVNK